MLITATACRSPHTCTPLLQLDKLSAREVAEELLQREYTALIAYEAARYPLKEKKEGKGSKGGKAVAAAAAAGVPSIEAVSALLLPCAAAGWDGLCCGWMLGCGMADGCSCCACLPRRTLSPATSSRALPPHHY